MAGDWQPTRNTSNQPVDQTGKSRFEITGFIQFTDKSYPWPKKFGMMIFNSFGVRKGREIHTAEVIKSNSLEGLLGIVRREKDFTLARSTDGWDIFKQFKGKKLDFIELDFTQWTPGNGEAAHHKLKLFDAHIRNILSDFRLIDKKTTKFERINGTFDKMEFETL